MSTHTCTCLQTEEDEEADDGVVWMTDTSAEAAKRRAEVRQGS